MINKNKIFDFKNLKNKNFENKIIKDFSFKKANLKKIDFKNSKIENSDFWLSNLERSDFSNAIIKNSVFSDVDLRKTSFKFAKIINTNFSHTNLKGIDFSKSTLINLNLRDAIFNKNTKWPKKFFPQKFGAIKEVKNILQKKKKLNNFEEKIIKKATKALINGDGYYVLKNIFSKKQINRAENQILKYSSKKIKKLKKSKIPIDKKFNQNWVYHLFNKDKVFRDMAHPYIVMKIFERILGDKFICGAFHANLLLPGARGQELHIDYPYYNFVKPGEKVKLLSKNKTISCHSLIMLSDFNEKNGGTVIVPGSQRLRKAPTKKDVEGKGYKNLTGKKGTVVLFNGLCWHRSGPNLSNKHRTCIIGQYLPQFIKPKYNELATLKKNILMKSSNSLKQLLGINLISNLIEK